MGKIDDVTKEYMSHNEIFADAFNFFLYGGRQVIKPENLLERDITEIAIPFGNQTADSVQRYRDVLKALRIMEDENAVYVLLGAELQANIHYAIPARNMLYDAINYVQQISIISRAHQNDSNDGLKGDEYLSRFAKSDKILPIITLVIYFGNKMWDGPLSIHDMFESSNETLRKFVPDYNINLICPAAMSDEDFENLHSGLRDVLKYIKYSINRKALWDMVNSDDRYKAIDRETANVINIVTDSKMTIKEKEDTVNMCEAIKEIREEGREEGRAAGREEGIEIGSFRMLVKLFRSGKLTASSASEEAGISVKEFEERAAAVKL
ncbi:MAG: Rpn family recombination-promoting nuclease/putative transposase [Anaerolineaceae bacterium]|nr:Rpn family recombination-promoting nuclease/putative transposase [Anaerolineaceae bacterium]